MIKCISKDALCTDEVYRVYSACMFAPTMEKFLIRVGEMGADPSVAAFGDYRGEELTGICIVRDAGNNAEILGIAVDAARRSSGIGRSLIEYVRTKYHKAIVAETDRDAVGFYRKCGFAVRKMTCRRAEQTYERFSCTREV